MNGDPIYLLNIRSQIAENVDTALTRHGHADEELSWDIAYAMMPMDESMGLAAFLIVSIASPVEGQFGISQPLTVDPRALRDAEQAERVVLEGLEQLRMMRSRLMAPTNGN